MARKKAASTAEDILRDILILQLASAGLTQHQIREVVGVDMHRVTRILKHIKRPRKNDK